MQYLVRPHVKHLCVLLPLVVPHVRHAHLGLHIAVILKGKTTYICSFGFNLAFTTTMGCSGSRISFGIITLL